MRGSKMRIVCCDLPPLCHGSSSITIYLLPSSRINKLSAIQDNEYFDKINFTHMKLLGRDRIWPLATRDFNAFGISNLSIIFEDKMDQNSVPTVIAEGYFQTVSMSTIDFQKDKRVANKDAKISEDSLEKYSVLSHLILDYFQRLDTEFIDYAEFRLGLRIIGRTVLEGKARQIFDVCNNSKGYLDASDLELALIMCDELKAADKYASVNIFDLFSSFDIDNRNRLTFHQFIECMKGPGVVSKNVSLDFGVLHFYFKRYSSLHNELYFDSFCKLWSHHFANVQQELKQRGYLTRKLPRFSTKYLPWRSHLYEKNQLYKIVVSLRRNKSDLLDLRKVIEGYRRCVQTNFSNARRTARETTRAQKRETLVKFNTRNRMQTSFFQDHVGRKIEGAKHRQHSMVKILRDCEKEISDKNGNIIHNRKEKDFIEESVIKISRTDRIDLQSQELNSIPSELYVDLQAKNRLMDVRILDLSCNMITEIPDLPFCFNLQSLRKLNISSNALKVLPTGINAMKALQILLLENNHLSILPSTIGELNNLQVLSVKGNNLSNLPNELCFLRNLRIIDLSSNQIQSLPDNIYKLEKLEIMDIKSNKVEVVADGLSNLINLSSLNISSNFLSSLPSNFGNLSNLEDLDLQNNRLKFLPDSMSTLSNLRIVNIEGNDLPELSYCTLGWIKLCSLHCKNCKLSHLSRKAFEGFENVVYISFEKNNIKTLPNEIGIAKSLVHLKLAYNVLEEVPVEIGALLMLETLDLSNNQLKSLPPEFCLLKSLLWLDISHNNLTELPQHFGLVSNLSVLKANNNSFCNLAESFGELQNLVTIQISHNNLSDIPSIWCKRFTHLTSLEADCNKIKYLPFEISQMRSLKLLSLRFNLLRSVPLELGNRMNLNGSRIEVLLEGNGFRDFPTKYMNMSRTNDSFFDWLYEECLVYKPSVEEWEIKKDLYLQSSLVLDDFLEGVRWRCDRLGVDLTKNSRDDRIRRLFYHCKTVGCPPSYVKLSYDEVIKRKQMTSMVCTEKDGILAEVQKRSHFQKEKEDQLYFSNFEGRQIAAVDRHNRFKQEQKQAKQMQAKILLEIVNRNLLQERKI